MLANQESSLCSFPQEVGASILTSDEAGTEAILAKAREAGPPPGAHYSGSVNPLDAWQLFASGAALLVDVRTVEEHKFVGHVPGSILVPWATGTSLSRNPRFVRELEQKTGKNKVLLLLCRSGKRSAEAAEAAVKSGFSAVFNVLEGFEGERDAEGQRGNEDGWRFHGLPWTQE